MTWRVAGPFRDTLPSKHVTQVTVPAHPEESS